MQRVGGEERRDGRRVERSFGSLRKGGGNKKGGGGKGNPMLCDVKHMKGGDSKGKKLQLTVSTGEIPKVETGRGTRAENESFFRKRKRAPFEGKGGEG